MLRLPVISSNVRAVGYDPLSKILEVEFGKDYPAGYENNRLYHYFDVPPEKHSEMMGFWSLGKYVNEVLTPEFSYRYIGTVAQMDS